MKCFAIRDDGAGYFLPPFFAPTDAVAIRMFIGSMGDSFAFRHQFHLFQFGHFDDDEGRLTADESPRLVLSGHSVPPDQDPRLVGVTQEAAE